MRNVRVLEVDPGVEIERIYAPLFKSKGISKSARSRVSAQLRKELQSILRSTVEDAIKDEAFLRSRNAYNIMRAGVRVYGSRISDLRGYIIGPEYVAMHDEGGTIVPKRAAGLTVPMPAALRPDGTPRLAGPRAWRNIKKTFWYTSKRTGRAYLVYKQGERLVFLYVLLDEVSLSKHKGFISRAWIKNRSALMEAVGQALLFEMGQVDLLELSRITYSGKKQRTTK